jgi:hypothetical protein
MPATNILADYLADTAHDVYAFAAADPSKDFPGEDRTGGTTGVCKSSLAGGSTCLAFVWFTPKSNGTFSDTLHLTYNDSLNNQNTDLALTGIGTAIGDLGPDVTVTLNPAARGGSHKSTLTLTNTGNGTSTPIGVPTLVMDYTTISKNNCLNPIAPGASCTIELTFSPPTSLFDGQKTSGSLAINYNDSTKSRSKTFSLEAYAYNPITISIDPVTTSTNPYNFGLVQINTSALKTFTITNNSLGLDIESNSLSATTSNVFSFVNSSCGQTIPAGESCTFDVKFLPTEIKVYTDNFNFTFNDGVVDKSVKNYVKGEGEAPNSIHNGWPTIRAIGNTNYYSKGTVVPNNNGYIKFSWKKMTPQSPAQITKYYIYRSEIAGVYNFKSAPYAIVLANTSDLSSKVYEYTDLANLVAGKTYYYTVRPYVTPYNVTSRTLETYTELKVVFPPINMAFLHRWAMNQEMCDRLGGFVTDGNQDFSCVYVGPGNSAGRYDIGYNLLIDRFELGKDKTAISGQTPITNLNQAQALEACKLQSFTLTGYVNPFVKRILTRKEFAVAALWPKVNSSNVTLTDADIVALETATASSSNCNAYGTVEATGNNSNCLSTFGLENMAGNVWEWVSDRVLNGVGVTDDTLRLDLKNIDLDNIDLGYTLNGSVYSQECFAIPMGLPFSKESGSCQGIRSTSGLGESYFHNNLHFSPGTIGLRGPVVGGSSYTTGTSGIYTTYWTNVNNANYGTRCGVEVP